MEGGQGGRWGGGAWGGGPWRAGKGGDGGGTREQCGSNKRCTGSPFFWGRRRGGGVARGGGEGEESVEVVPGQKGVKWRGLTRCGRVGGLG